MEDASNSDDFFEIDLNEFEVKTMKKGSFFILVDELFDQGISKNIIENLLSLLRAALRLVQRKDMPDL